MFSILSLFFIFNRICDFIRFDLNKRPCLLELNFLGNLTTMQMPGFLREICFFQPSKQAEMQLIRPERSSYFSNFFLGRYVSSVIQSFCIPDVWFSQEHLFELEADENTSFVQPNQAIYIVYPDETAKNWRVQAVPAAPESFESRKALPEPWRGLRDDELSNVTGIEGGIFVHASGFIGGTYREF